MSKPDIMDVDKAHAAAAADDDDDDDDNDDDPIVASYDVYLNPAMPLGRRLLVLQQPNRTDDAPRPSPTELRLKAQSGMVELDMPLDHAVAYDRDKGLRWGRVLQSSMAAKNGGSHGLAGGFGFGAVQQRGRKKGEGYDDEYLEWSEAVRQDKVLRTQTLGGQFPDTDEVQYMVGVFQGKNLHLTPVSSIVHLRPQLHHIDAATQLEKSASAAAASNAVASSSGTTTSSATAARAIHMTIKNTADGDAVAVETMADRLRCVQSEPWRKLRYTDENEEAAWDVYNESLFLHPPGPSGAAAATADAKPRQPAPEDLQDLVPRFASRWGEKQMLPATSGIVKPDVQQQPAQPAQPGARVKTEPGAHEAQTATRSSLKSAAAAPNRTGRGKAPARTISID